MNQNNKEFIEQVENFVNLCMDGNLSVPQCIKMYTDVYRFINSASSKWCEAEEILNTVCLNKFTWMKPQNAIEHKIRMIAHAFAFLERVRIGDHIPINQSLLVLYEKVNNKE